MESEPRTVPERTYAVIRLLVLATILGYLAWRIYDGRDALGATTLRWSTVDIMAAFASAALALQCLPIAWLILLKRLGLYRAGHLGDYAYIWWTSFLYRYVPGKVMLVIERARMGRTVGIPPVVGGGLAVVETLLAVLAGSAVSLFAVGYYAAGDGLAIFAFAAAAAVAVFLLPTVFVRLKSSKSVQRRFPELDAVKLSRRDLAIVLLPLVLHYLLLGLSFFFVARGFTALTLRDLPGLTGIYALSHVISLVALIAPAGLGVREGALAVQLYRLLPGGVAEALAIGIRVWFTLVELVSYLAVVVLAPRRSREPENERAH